MLHLIGRRAAAGASRHVSMPVLAAMLTEPQVPPPSNSHACGSFKCVFARQGTAMCARSCTGAQAFAGHVAQGSQASRATREGQHPRPGHSRAAALRLHKSTARYQDLRYAPLHPGLRTPLHRLCRLTLFERFQFVAPSLDIGEIPSSVVRCVQCSFWCM